MTRDEARQTRDRLQQELRDTPQPQVGLPRIEWWQKALIMGGIAFVIFAVPFATYRRPVVETVLVPAPVQKREPQKAAAPVNDGGWSRRREKYGPSGRKQRGVHYLKQAS